MYELISEKHLDSIGNGADFAEFDDESDLLSAVEKIIEWIENNKKEGRNEKHRKKEY